MLRVLKARLDGGGGGGRGRRGEGEEGGGGGELPYKNDGAARREFTKNILKNYQNLVLWAWLN